MKRALTLVLILALTVFWLTIGMPSLFGYDKAIADAAGTRVTVDADGNVREYGWGLIRFNGKGPERWRYSAVSHYGERKLAETATVRARRQLAAARRELRAQHQPSALNAIALAAVAYDVDTRTLYRKARCETGGTFSPYAKNPRSTASGLFQFLTSTWATTPYARFSIWDPYASALAAAYMHRVGRGGEWSCR